MTPTAEEDAAREIAARKRDLERDFEAKMRDLKAQHKRQADRLQKDRAEWEEHRRAQKSELAARVETLRRQEENRRLDAEALRTTRRELEEVKQAAQQQVPPKPTAKGAFRAEARLTARLEASQRLLGRSLLVAALVAVGAALATAAAAPQAVYAVAGLGLLAVLGLQWRRRKLAQP